MPYYLHRKNEEPESGIAFPTASSAKESLDPHTHQITFKPTAAESEGWRVRERGRFETAEYFAVPWSHRWECRDHFAHLSRKQPGMIAYTKTEEHGVQDRQTTMKPGRYLQEFYGKDGYFCESTIADYIGECSAQNFDLHVTQDADTIAEVYINGPDSCMKHEFANLPCHPTTVYAGPDLALAYIGTTESPRARAIVWPDRKRWNRIYGDIATMNAILASEGYARGSLRGARIHAIEWKRNWIMPYIDYVGNASEDGKYLVLDDEGPIDTQPTCGYASQIALSVCSNCDTSYNPDDDDASSEYCAACYADRVTCESCSEEGWINDYHSLERGGWLCDDCYSNELQTCTIDDCGDDWIERDLPSDQQQLRRRQQLTNICVSCARTWYHCTECDNHVRRDTPCEHAPAADGLPVVTIADPDSAPAVPRILQETLRLSNWAVAANVSRCRIRHCRATIHAGHAFVATPEGFGYCVPCMEGYRRAEFPVPPIPDAARSEVA